MTGPRMAKGDWADFFSWRKSYQMAETFRTLLHERKTSFWNWDSHKNASIIKRKFSIIPCPDNFCAGKNLLKLEFGPAALLRLTI
jgi:hypothetical protein